MLDNTGFGSWMTLGLCAALAFGCGKEDGGGSEGSGGGSEGSGAKPVGAEPGGSDQPAARSLPDLFGDKAGEVVPFKGIEFGMAKADVIKAAPDFEKGTLRDAWGIEDADLRPVYHTDPETVRYLHVELPKQARDVLVDKWGEPVKAKVSSAKDGEFWQNAESGVQAVLEQAAGGYKLMLFPFMPFKQMLGDKPTTLGFEIEGKPLVSLSPDQVVEAYAAFFPKRLDDGRVTLSLPGYEFHMNPATVQISWEGDKVKQVHFVLHHGYHPPLEAEIKDALTVKFGEGKKNSAGNIIYSEKGPRIVRSDSEPTKQISLHFSP